MIISVAVEVTILTTPGVLWHLERAGLAARVTPGSTPRRPPASVTSPQRSEPRSTLKSQTSSRRESTDAPVPRTGWKSRRTPPTRNPRDSVGIASLMGIQTLSVANRIYSSSFIATLIPYENMAFSWNSKPKKVGFILTHFCMLWWMGVLEFLKSNEFNPNLFWFRV